MKSFILSITVICSFSTSLLAQWPGNLGGNGQNPGNTGGGALPIADNGVAPADNPLGNLGGNGQGNPNDTNALQPIDGNGQPQIVPDRFGNFIDALEKITRVPNCRNGYTYT